MIETMKFYLLGEKVDKLGRIEFDRLQSLHRKHCCTLKMNEWSYRIYDNLTARQTAKASSYSEWKEWIKYRIGCTAQHL